MTDDGSDGNAQAVSRLAQLSEHLADPDTPRSETKLESRRKRKTAQHPELPADYSDVLGQIDRLKQIANTPDQHKTGYIRQKQAGKLWVRERIEKFLDKGSFREIGSIAGKVSWRQTGPTSEDIDDFQPTNNLNGFGKLNGRRCLITMDDFSVRGGHADGAIYAKTVYLEKLALQLKLPVVKIVDGSSGGGSVTTIATNGWSYVPPLDGGSQIIAQLNAGIPNLGAGMGSAIGLGAARLVVCHFSVMPGDIGSLFNAGPKVVENATFEEGLSFTDLGGPGVHCTNGTIDNLAANEAEAFEQIRTVLGYLPNCGASQIPPITPVEDPINRTSPELATLIPRNRDRGYDARKMIRTIVDQNSFFEIGALWGRTAIVGLSTMGGRPVGIICNNSEVLAGALDAQGSQKITRHLKFCDVFNLPILQFVDVPGYAIGTVAERAATMRWGVELWKTYFTTTVPIFNIIVRKAYGVAGSVMVECRETHNRVAWPSGEWGSLPLAGGIEVGHAAELRKIEKDQGTDARNARYGELLQTYQRLMNPVRTANHFGIEEIIDPSTTRPLLGAWTKMMYETELPERIVKRISGILKPQFA